MTLKWLKPNVWLSEDDHNLLGKFVPVKGNTIVYVSMC